MRSITFEIGLNTLDLEEKGLWESEWWFELGVSYQTTRFHSTHNKLFSIGLGLVTINIRW